MTYVEQSTEIASILGLLRGELAHSAAAVGLEGYVSRLERLNGEFSEILAVDKSEGVTTDQVRAAYGLGQENLLQALAMIIGRYPKPDHVATRGKLLQPIFEQNEAIRSYLRARRAVRDVDPRTGEESEEAGPAPAEPTDQPV